MPNPQQTEAQPAAAQTATPEPMTTAVGGGEVAMVQLPRDFIDLAEAENMKRDFTHALLTARNPPPKPEYRPPALSDGMVKQRDLEMAAGRQRVAEFAANEEHRKRIHEAHQNDKWQNPGANVSVFRPNDYVPDQKKGQGYVGGGSPKR